MAKRQGVHYMDTLLHGGMEVGMGKFDIVLWDVDQTLLDFKKSESYAIKTCYQKFGKEAGEETVALYSAINEGFWKRIEKGEIDKKDALIQRFLILFDKTGEKGMDAELFQKEYADALGSVYYYLDDSYELVKKLKGKCRQYLVTNGGAYTQTKKLRLSGLSGLVDGIFISEQIGAQKPRKEFFDKCFSLIPGFQKEKTIIVGDSLSSDMLGGSNAGIATCWYNPRGCKNELGVQVNYEIKNLNEIYDILEG